MQSVDMLLEPLRAFLSQIGVFLPRLMLALLAVVIGWMLAKLLSFAVVKALRTVNFHVLTERSGMDGFMRQGGLQRDTGSLFGLLVYWLVIIASLIVAFNFLGLTYVTDLLHRVVLFLPKIFVALLVLTLGGYFARFVGQTVEARASANALHDAELIGTIAHYAVFGFVILIALDQVDIGGPIVRDSFLIVLAGVVFAAALAVGLGLKDWVARRLDERWPGTPRPPANAPKVTKPDLFDDLRR
jgi:mechanosensitive ion channel-like protein